MAQREKQTDKQTSGHGDSMTESAKLADSVKIVFLIIIKISLSITVRLVNLQNLRKLLREYFYHPLHKTVGIRGAIHIREKLIFCKH